MRRCHLYISGIVQGVGFRYFAKRQAIKVGLKGWVRNLSDGRVECLVEGEASALKEFASQARTGPAGSVVEDVKILESEASGEFTQMTILPDS